MTNRNRSLLRVPALLAATSSLIVLTLIGAEHPAHAAVQIKPYFGGAVSCLIPETITSICNLNVDPGCTDPCIAGDPGCTPGTAPTNGKIVLEDICRAQLFDPLNHTVPAKWLPNQVGDYEFIEEGCPNVPVPDPLAGNVLNPCVSDLVRFVNITLPDGTQQGEMWFISDSPTAADLAALPVITAPGVFKIQQETNPPTAAGNSAKIYRISTTATGTMVNHINVTSDLNNLLVQSDTLQMAPDVPAMSPVGVIALSLLLVAGGAFFIMRRRSFRIG